MKKLLARVRGGSFIAGILVGLSIVVPVIVLTTGATLTDWQTFLLFGAPMILVLGITLQAVITAKPRHERGIDRALGDYPNLQANATTPCIAP